jgi:hypothetical protein
MTQAEEEKSIFLDFASISGLPIDLNSIANREPPEPDITCEVSGEGIVGFELTELIDREFMAWTSLACWTKSHLYETWHDNLDDYERTKLQEKFKNALLHFVYVKNATKRKRTIFTREILRELIDLPDNFEGAALSNPIRFPDILQEVRISRGIFQGPIFDVESVGWLGDPTAPAIRKKLMNVYSCNYPIELLAHIDIDVLPPEEVWMAAADEAADLLTTSQFRRIWVFDRSKKTIRYKRDK